MKKIIRITALIIIAVSFYSCFSQRPLSRERPDNNRTYRVEYLFEHDGCRVYRFRDQGHYVYFTNCGGDVTSMVNDSTRVRVSTIGRQ
ncbi:MAG: DUF4884 domain-containing protein [Bacteroidota bacterium]